MADIARKNYNKTITSMLALPGWTIDQTSPKHNYQNGQRRLSFQRKWVRVGP
jgi:hypothetical protein